MISWKKDHFSLLSFLEILNFWILKNLEIDTFHRNGKMPSFLWLKNHLLYANLTTRCQKVENIALQTNLNYYQIWLAEKLSTWLLSSGQDFNKKFLDSKHGLKVYFKPSRKNQNFLFLPLPSKLASLKNDHLTQKSICTPSRS